MTKHDLERIGRHKEREKARAIQIQWRTEEDAG